MFVFSWSSFLHVSWPAFLDSRGPGCVEVVEDDLFEGKFGELET